MFDSIAFAMGAPQAGAQPAGGMGMLASFMPFILMFVIFWFLLIRPQQKRAKAHREMLESLKRGDKVITQSGLIGVILELEKEEFVMQCGEAKLRLSRAAIGGVLSNEKASKAERKAERRAEKQAEKVEEEKRTTAENVEVLEPDKDDKTAQPKAHDQAETLDSTNKKN